MNESARTRVLIVHNIIAPYRLPLFRAIAAHSDIDLTVWFMARSARNRRWKTDLTNPGFEYRVLPGFALGFTRTDLFEYIVNYTFPADYLLGNFDVMISAGWLDFASQAGFFLSKIARKKYILWSESTVFEPSWRRSIAQPLVRTIVSRADASIAVGTRSRAYLRHLGARDSSIFTALSTVDIERFQRLSRLARPRRDQRRLELGIRRRRVVLYCGQLIERKGLRDLLEAFGMAKRAYDDVALVLVGHGPLRQSLACIAEQLGLSDVHFVDHIDMDQMPAMYALADLFVLPSLEETWGLVVNEALACGLPVIVTDRVGSCEDLVENGRNGFIVRAGDARGLADRISQVLVDAALLDRLAAGTERDIERLHPQHSAEGFVAAIRHVRAA
jgi:glycosyltransferase involved in cell wall biosynthesis